ncbi:MAG: hypothetical protein HYX24_05725 [Candidatus Aenigmarchaeota archaeon]|nr:hypothetical protein [Candidatus Aenigmarchaeota archaeon]
MILSKSIAVRRNIFIPLLIFSLTSGMAYAVGQGGGGGGDGGSSGGSSTGGSTGSAGSPFTLTACRDDGSVSFIAGNLPQPVKARNTATNETFEVPGNYEPYFFNSDEAVFVKQGNYEIIGVRDSQFRCPGLAFSCKLASAEAKSCAISNGSLRALFGVRNITSLDNFEYRFRTASRILTHDKSAYSSELKGLSVSKTDSGYSLSVSLQEKITAFEIVYTPCASGKYKVSSSVACTESPAIEPQNPAEDKFQCSSLPDMRERVKCRLSFSKEEAYEQAKLLYLPEECRALEGADKMKCIGVYKLVQKCWRLEAGNERVSCVRKHLDFEGIKNGIDLCRQKISGEEERCKRELLEKAFAVIKFRIYDLEERAEEMMEKGLDKEIAADFVAGAESLKVMFNNAKTIAEKRNIILDVRSMWKDFIRKAKESGYG